MKTLLFQFSNPKHVVFSVSRVLTRYSSQSRLDLNRQIETLCNNGQIQDAIELATNAPPSDSTLSSLLRGSKNCKSMKSAAMTMDIWNHFVNIQQIRPSVKSYCFAINALSKHQSHWKAAYRLITEMKYQCDYKSFGSKHWWSILDAFSAMKDANNMMFEYKLMIDEYPSIKLNKFIVVSLLEGLIRCGDVQYIGQIDSIWNDIQCQISVKNVKPHELFDGFVVHLFMVCFDRMRHSPAHCDLMLTVWTTLTEEYRIDPDVGCQCMAIIAFSRNATHSQIHRDKAMEILNDIDSKTLRKLSAVQFRQVLTGYANVGELDKMWKVYDEFMRINNTEYDVEALNVMISRETNEDKVRDILEIVCSALNGGTRIDTKQMMSFYRIALRLGDQEKIQKFSVEMERDQRTRHNVTATFWMKGREYRIDSGYIPQCPFRGVFHVERLMEQIGYRMDVSAAPEMKSEIAARKLLKSHSEKKALAISLLWNENETRDVNVEVDMRMCSDCHQFFCAVSDKFRETRIHCTDPKGVHLFVNGQCLLCT